VGVGDAMHITCIQTEIAVAEPVGCEHTNLT
jgi:hypothetical protein